MNVKFLYSALEIFLEKKMRACWEVRSKAKCSNEHARACIPLSRYCLILFHAVRFEEGAQKD
jgi:hypothetical protein